MIPPSKCFLSNDSCFPALHIGHLGFLILESSLTFFIYSWTWIFQKSCFVLLILLQLSGIVSRNMILLEQWISHTPFLVLRFIPYFRKLAQAVLIIKYSLANCYKINKISLADHQNTLIKSYFTFWASIRLINYVFSIQKCVFTSIWYV